MITKAIIPVAGWGTRMLPITKSIEKCMLPVGTRPVIDYVVRDVVAAGITDIYFVVGEQSTQIESYYRTNIKLNDYLRKKGKPELLETVAPLSGVNIHFITQPATGGYGTSIPAGLASEFVNEGESALYLNGDQFYLRSDGGSNAADLIASAENRGLSAALYGVEMPIETIDSSIEKDDDENFVRIIEKPAPGTAPSNLQNAGFYLFSKEIFELARTLPVNQNRGEFEITDAINAYVSSGKKIAVATVKGQYMECGSPAGWLKANNYLAEHS